MPRCSPGPALCGAFFAPIILPEAEKEPKGDHAMRGPAVRTDAVLGRPDFTQAVVLTTGSSNGVALDTPAGAGFVNFSFNTDIWVSYGSTVANIPSSTTTAGTTTPEFNPTMRNITSTAACTGITIASEVAGKGSVSWFKPA